MNQTELVEESFVEKLVNQLPESLFDTLAEHIREQRCGYYLGGAPWTEKNGEPIGCGEHTNYTAQDIKDGTNTVEIRRNGDLIFGAEVKCPHCGEKIHFEYVQAAEEQT